jgi:hypothetical protein
MRRGDCARAGWWRIGKRSLTAAIVPMQYLAIVALIVAAPISAFAQQTERHHQAANDSILIKLMNAQTHAFEEYTRCLENSTVAAPCEPPRPLQLPPTQEPLADRAAYSEAVVASVARALRDAEIRAIKAHAHCVRTKQSEMCGRAP